MALLTDECWYRMWCSCSFFCLSFFCYFSFRIVFLIVLDLESSLLFTGRLIGHYYDDKGEPTEAMKQYKKKLQEAKKAKLSEEDDRKLFPPCNFEYKQGWGRRRWCSTMR